MTIGDNLEHFLALAGETKTGRLERMLQPFSKRGMFKSGNTVPRITLAA
jgi:hypothetical protein